MGTLRIGTRGSALALWQTDWLVRRLSGAYPELSAAVEVIRVQSDRQPETPIPAMDGRGVFTHDIEQALLDGGIDVAVHSLKDLPSVNDPRLTLAAVSPREDPRDVLVTLNGAALSALPAASRVGTSSLRRQALVRHARPDCSVLPLRGNIDTRLRKLRAGEYDAIVMAGAAVRRLNLDAAVAPFPVESWVPAVSQGIIGVQARAADHEVVRMLACIGDPTAMVMARAEREVLRLMGGGCTVPLGALASVDGRSLRLAALVAAPDGSRVVTASAEGSSERPEDAAATVAAILKASGAEEILSRLRESVPLMQGAKGE